MTISLQHLTGTSLTLFISVFLSLEIITFCFVFVCFFLSSFQFCVVMVMQIASLREREAFFSIMFYSAACQVVTTMGLALSYLQACYGPAVSQVVVCLSDWLCVLFLATQQTERGTYSVLNSYLCQSV